MAFPHFLGISGLPFLLLQFQLCFLSSYPGRSSCPLLRLTLGETGGCSRVTSSAPEVGAFRVFYSSKAVSFVQPPSAAGHPGMATSSAAIPVCLPSIILVPFVSLQLLYPAKEEESLSIRCLVEWAAFCSLNSECRASGPAGAAGGYFCCRAEEFSCSRLSLWGTVQEVRGSVRGETG